MHNQSSKVLNEPVSMSRGVTELKNKLGRVESHLFSHVRLKKNRIRFNQLSKFAEDHRVWWFSWQKYASLLWLLLLK